MRTIEIPIALTLDRRIDSTSIHLAAVMATIVDENGFVIERQAELAERLKTDQATVVAALAYLRDAGAIAVLQHADHGMIYKLLWVKPKASEPKRFTWVEVRDTKTKTSSFMRIENAPEDREALAAYIQGRGLEFIRLKGEPLPPLKG